MNLVSTKDKFMFILMVLTTTHAIISYINILREIRNSHRVLYKSRVNSITISPSALNTRMIRVLIISFEIMIASGSFSLLFISPNNTNESDISIRIENISTDLLKASSELSLIQQELEARIETVESLKAEAEIAENMISLSEEQVNAVQAKIHQEVDANSSKNLLQNILISSFFFLLGLFVQPVFHAIKNRFAKTDDNNTGTKEINTYSYEEIDRAVKLLDTIKQQQEN